MKAALYKTVHLLAVELLKAAEAENDSRFQALYTQLQNLCEENEGDEAKNHPVQWETLADFSDDNDVALALYHKALLLAEAMQEKDYVSSISYSCGQVLWQKGDKEGALSMAIKAKKSAAGSADKELKNEINSLLALLK